MLFNRLARPLLVSAALTLLFIGLAFLFGGCFAPPALQPSIFVRSDVAMDLYPPGTESVELSVGSGEKLRGLFIPAADGAPVVLHLLESSGSVATLKFHYAVLCRRLRGLGYASLIVDYRGMGASDGKRSTRNLLEDARAMWVTALQYAGGDSTRVVVRGISLGTVATAMLLEDGIEPGALILHAPVFGDSAIQRFAQHRYGALVRWFSGALFREISSADLPQELRRYQGPVLVVAGGRDLFLSDAERERLAEAVDRDSGRFQVPAAGHLKQTILAHAMDGAELELLATLFPPQSLDDAEVDELLRSLTENPQAGPRAVARFDEPQARVKLRKLGGMARNASALYVAAIAIQNDVDLGALRYLWMLDEGPLPSGLAFEQLLDSVSLEDPAGRLEMDQIMSVAQFTDHCRRFGGGGQIDDVYSILVRTFEALESGSGQWTVSVDLPWDHAEFTSDPLATIVPLRARGIGEAEVHRVAVRSLLKGARVPERVTRLSNGTAQLQVLKEGGWVPLDLDPGHAPLTMAGAISYELGWQARSLLKEHGEGLPPPSVMFDGHGLRFVAPASE